MKGDPGHESSCTCGLWRRVGVDAHSLSYFEERLFLLLKLWPLDHKWSNLHYAVVSLLSLLSVQSKTKSQMDYRQPVYINLNIYVYLMAYSLLSTLYLWFLSFFLKFVCQLHFCSFCASAWISWALMLEKL